MTYLQPSWHSSGTLYENDLVVSRQLIGPSQLLDNSLFAGQSVRSAKYWKLYEDEK